MNESPIAKAQELLEDIRHSRPLKDRAAWALLHQEQAAECIEDLIAFHAGFEAGSAAEERRLIELVSALVAAIAPLFERSSTPFGRPSDHRQWLTGTAPRLKQAFERATEYLSQ